MVYISGKVDLKKEIEYALYNYRPICVISFNFSRNVNHSQITICKLTHNMCVFLSQQFYFTHKKLLKQLSFLCEFDSDLFIVSRKYSDVESFMQHLTLLQIYFTLYTKIIVTK